MIASLDLNSVGHSALGKIVLSVVNNNFHLITGKTFRIA